MKQLLHDSMLLLHMDNLLKFVSPAQLTINNPEVSCFLHSYDPVLTVYNS